MSDALIERTAAHVRAAQEGEGSGHDWWHTYRVWQMARRIGKAEGVDLRAVELAALLHDLADWKAHDGDEEIGPRTAGEWLRSQGVPADLIDEVTAIIGGISYKGADVAAAELSRAGQVVQDADRLDAIGAIGIARVFAYGGAKGQSLHDPDLNPTAHRTAEAYFRDRTTSINHFYEKLLLLKDRMHTATGRQLAEERHTFLEEFLRRFHQEWEGS